MCPPEQMQAYTAEQKLAAPHRDTESSIVAFETAPAPGGDPNKLFRTREISSEGSSRELMGNNSAQSKDVPLRAALSRPAPMKRPPGISCNVSLWHTAFEISSLAKFGVGSTVVTRVTPAWVC